MSLEQLMSLAQTLKLSPTLLQSMSILQMNTQELSDYLNDLALENPVMEYTEAPSGQLSWEEFSHQVPWLGDAPAPTASGEGPAEPASAGETDSLALLVNQQLDRLHLTPPLLALCRYLAETLDDHGRLDPADLEGLTQAGVPTRRWKHYSPWTLPVWPPEAFPSAWRFSCAACPGSRSWPSGSATTWTCWPGGAIRFWPGSWDAAKPR